MLIKEDVKRYIGSRVFSFWEVIKACYFAEGLLFGVLFRICQAIGQIKNPILRTTLKLIFVWILYRFCSVILGIHIDIGARIGKGLYIGHYGGIFIGPVVIGDYCNISQQVTIGEGRLGTLRQGLPSIGDYVYIAPGAKIFGKITIGNNASIGANAVISKDIPDNAVVVGNPGRIVGYQDDNISINNVPE
ncbi:MAG: serine acetyltransferase [Deltaproteobacteria bacterium]|nr:serine acetyltransferase [Deltaproteobacteria bacterium]